MVSKAANYCYPTYGHNLGLMLLCDVALGKTRNPCYAASMEGLPNEIEQSVKGCGETFPTEYSTLDGVKVAVGGLQKANFPTSLQYNEYVVYDIAQVKMKYLVKMKFNYNRGKWRKIIASEIVFESKFQFYSDSRWEFVNNKYVNCKSVLV